VAAAFLRELLEQLVSTSLRVQDHAAPA
jgi:hypothetical protein